MTKICAIIAYGTVIGFAAQTITRIMSQPFLVETRILLNRLWLLYFYYFTGDSLSVHGNKAFSTKDRDNDENVSDGASCATAYKGAWWYRDCHSSSLNGLYLGGPHESYGDGVIWSAWKGYYYSLKQVEMKMRMAP